MDELKKHYDDLNNLIANLSLTAEECTDEYYKDEILELTRRVQIDVEEIEPRISKLEKEEQKELENEFGRSRL